MLELPSGAMDYMNKFGIKLFEVIDTTVFFATLPFFYLERVYHKKSFGWKEKFGNIEFNDSDKKVIMFHACSVGEVAAIENLVKSAKDKFGDCKIVVTTGTKTGQDIAHKKLGEVADYITYFPFDIPLAVNKFLDRLKPSVVVIAETEIWPYFAYGCKSRNIPLMIINGRISDSTYNSYKIVAPFFKQVFENFSAVYVQSEDDGRKYVSIGMRKDDTKFMGNLKFDIQPKSQNIDLGQKGYRVLLAGSTHGGENRIILETYKKLDCKDLKLLIAPRHLERVPEIEALIKEMGMSYGLKSKGAMFTDNDIIILDTLGELGKMYSICDIAFIGGSFVKVGGHNPLEAAIYDKPTISGPSIHNFKDIYSILTKENASVVVKSKDELYITLKELFSDATRYNNMVQACKSVFESQRGATNFVLDRIDECLTK